MEEKKITNGPITVDLEEGKKYAWCTCGKTAKKQEILHIVMDPIMRNSYIRRRSCRRQLLQFTI
jgi:hypothetical protein